MNFKNIKLSADEINLFLIEILIYNFFQSNAITL